MSFDTFPFRQASHIRMLVMDVDGVLTDGGIILDHAGQELKQFNVRDGHGIKLLQRAGIQTAILTGRTSSVVKHRARELGVGYVIQGSLNKSDGLDELVKQADVPTEVCAFIGDDVLDLPPMRRCGVSMAPADAHESVLSEADWVSAFRGGRGAVRQAAEGLIIATGSWQQVIGGPYGVSPAACGWPD
jgi:3-deoxy-D-manno-octulosonate 8-phosphate phosphatase (KDO 8-P phosphatase)